MHAREIIQQLSKRYAACKSYRDSGVFVREETGGMFTFRTYFQQPWQYRLDWIEQPDGPTFSVWCDGQRAFTGYPWNTKEEMENITLALSSAAAISGALSGTITTLLMPRLRGFRTFDTFESVELLDDEEIDGHPNFHVRLRDPRHTKEF